MKRSNKSLHVIHLRCILISSSHQLPFLSLLSSFSLKHTPSPRSSHPGRCRLQQFYGDFGDFWNKRKSFNLSSGKAEIDRNNSSRFLGKDKVNVITHTHTHTCSVVILRVKFLLPARRPNIAQVTRTTLNADEICVLLSAPTSTSLICSLVYTSKSDTLNSFPSASTKSFLNVMHKDARWYQLPKK